MFMPSMALKYFNLLEYSVFGLCGGDNFSWNMGAYMNMYFI